jgi:hypothetical protein
MIPDQQKRQSLNMQTAIHEDSNKSLNVLQSARKSKMIERLKKSLQLKQFSNEAPRRMTVD